jgi:hypothetical protein
MSIGFQASAIVGEQPGLYSDVDAAEKQLRQFYRMAALEDVEAFRAAHCKAPRDLTAK